MIVVNLSNFCWVNGQKRRNQAIFGHLMLDTDGFEEGLFIQPPMVRIARVFQFLRPPELEVTLQTREFGQPVTVLQPVLTLPPGYPALAVRRAAAELTQKLLSEFLRERPFLLWINSISHFSTQIAEQLMPRADFRVFDGSEMLLMYERQSANEHFRQRAAILKACEVAVCENESTLCRLKHPAKRVLNFGTEIQIYKKPAMPLQIHPLFPKPAGSIYIGFTGMVTADKMDFDLLHAVFTRFPGYQFIFIGTTNRPSLLARLKTYRNFHHIPEVNEETRGAMMREFDVAIVPELDNECARKQEAEKILSYLACGIPVLSTPCTSASKYRDAIYFAASVWEFSHTLERLATKNKAHDPKIGLELAFEGSWNHQIPDFMDWLVDRQREQVRAQAPTGSRVTSPVKAFELY